MANLLLIRYEFAVTIKHFPNVTSFLDRHGQRRWRYRKSGHRQHSFKSAPGMPGFEDEYRWASEQLEAPKPRVLKPVAPIPLVAMAGVELIYFVACAAGPVKIGHTTNIASRFLRLQTGNHRPLRLLAVMPGSVEDEARLHKRFAGQRAHGEWFNRGPELNRLIRDNPIAWWRTEILVAKFAQKIRARTTS